jgi:DNA-binding SARP family transcriptional activator
MGGRWRIEMLGGLRVVGHGRVLTHFRTRKATELLAYLAYHHTREHPREILMELLWPGDEVEAARHRLTVELSALRKELEPPGVPDGAVLVRDRFMTGLSSTAVRTDVAEFEAALRGAARAENPEERARELAAAVELYRGELLPGCYEDWITPERQRLDERYFQALRQLIAHLEVAGDFNGALQLALQAVSANRLREEAHQEVMRLYAAADRPDAALRQYRELGRLLQADLDTTPGPETAAMAARIAKSGSALSTTLPAAGTPSASMDPALPEAPPGSPRAARSRTVPGSEPAPRDPYLEPVGGAVPLQSRFYVVREADHAFQAGVARGDSIVLVKGARQVGKTSLLARGLQRAREAGRHVALCSLQELNDAHMESPDRLLCALAESLADQLDLEVRPAEVWDERRGPNPNFRRYVRREVLGQIEGSLVWGLDEVDRLIPCPFASEVFGLFRSWHDARVLDPSGPWFRLSLAIAYSTEAHLFITDVNQSPFNVGTRVTLDDFSRDQVTDLNGRHGFPLRDRAEIERFFGLVGGHPYLVRQGLHELAVHATGLDALDTGASHEEGIFGAHLRRIRALLRRDFSVCEVVRDLLRDGASPDADSFYRLRSAGLVIGHSPEDARVRCGLYERYLRQHFA